MVWRQWLIRFSNSVWLLAVGVLVLLAVYVALGRNLMPLVPAYSQDIEDYVEKMLGMPVEMGSIRGSWDGLDPVLLVHQVRLNPQAPDAENESSPFIMRDFRLRLNVWESLRRQKLIFQDIYAAGISLQLRQDKNGRWEIRGLPFESQEPSSGWETFRQYLDQPNVDVAEVQVTLESHDGATSVWKLPRVHMRDLGRSYEASGTLLQPELDERFLQFSLKGKGNPFAGDFSGQLYVDWQSGAFIDPFLEAYSLSGVRIFHMDAAGRAWLTWQDNQLDKVVGDLRVDALQWRTDLLSIAPIEDLSLRFQMTFTENGWLLTADSFDFQWRDKQWMPAAFRITRQQSKEPAPSPSVDPTDTASPATTSKDPGAIVVQMDRLPLGLMSELSQATQLLPIEGVDELAGRDPKGELQNLLLRVPLESRDQPLFDLRANLVGVSVEAFRSAPGIGGLDGFLSLTEQRGVVEFSSQDLSLAFPELYEQGWTFAHGEGAVSWRRVSQATEVDGRGLVLRLNEGQGELHGGFHLLLGDNVTVSPVESHFALSLGFRDVQAARAESFMPCRLIDRDICDWVADNLKEGVVKEGSYLYNGSIEDGAEDYVSRLFLRLNDAALSYHPDWPMADQVDATLLLDGSALDVALHQARVAGSNIENARIWIPPVEESGELQVNVAIQAALNSEQVNYWLKESPLKAQTGDWVKSWSFGGQFLTDVALQVPLSGAAMRAQVATKAQDASLRVPEAALELKKLQGSLRYDSVKGLSASKLRAEHLGQPLQMDLQSPLWQDSVKSVQIQARGRAALNEIYRWRQMEPIPGLNGAAAYSASLLVETGGAAPRLTVDVQSDLQGIASDWPEPFRKDAAEIMSVRYVQQFESASSVSEAQIAVENLLKSKFVFEKGQYRQGVIAFGQDDLQSDYPGLLIRGQLDRADGDAWREFLGTHLTKAGDASSTPAVQLDLNLKQLRIMERDLDEVFFGLTRQDAGWTLRLRNQQQIDGMLQFPDAEDQPVIARFEYLRLPTVDEKQIESKLSPTTVPLLDLVVKDLMLGEQNYGAWSFVTERRDEGTVFKDVVGKSGGADLNGRLSWLQDPETKQHTTIVTGTIKGSQVENFLENWGKTSSVTSNRMEFEVGLVWPAPPTEFDIARASGSISLRMEDGVFRETSRSADAVRIFGVLNMESVTRRLRLDFSDLYEKGLSYDLMEGKASLSYGVMKFEQPLAVKGPSSAFKITGQADLKEENLDMEMVTILPVTKNLPLAAVLVGAPQVGGALFLIDRLLGDPLSRLTSVTYNLKGSFQEPQVDVKNVFDTKVAPRSSEARRSNRSAETSDQE